MSILDQTRLRELLDYDPETGVFLWRNSSRRGWEGKQAGCIKPGAVGGYRLIRVCGELFRASTLAWVYMTGEWPSEDVDHKNLNRADDSWSNLRLANRSQNMANGSLRCDNTSGYRGVIWYKPRSKWLATVKKNGRNYYCGLYTTAEEAAVARDAKAAVLHGEFARLNTNEEEVA